ncbi:MAG: DUF1932 domain-containing protein [Desulfovibrio sp.]|jgi:3-hydroxyisobutyrate dehydrogenase-like beta-hydroxyacid dehydrogenase|nr:DUF1932 domain-containing protein [Desulfovibrio sp.]
MNTTIALIGFGEAAYHLCRGFKEENITGIKAFDVLLESGRKDQIDTVRKRAEETGVSLVDSLGDIMSADIIFLCVPAKFAESATMEAMPFLAPEKLYIDVTTNRPAVKEKLGALMKEKGVLYVDASVMGAVPLYKHRTPTLVCGNGAEKMRQTLGPLGMDLTYVGEAAGRAVKMKLTRSIFIKGIEALTLEMLLTARKLGIEDEIMAGLHKSFEVQGFTRMVEQLVTSNVMHSSRRAVEADECMELITESGFEPVMMEAAKRKLKWSANIGFTKLKPVPECTTLSDLYVLWEKLGVCVSEGKGGK